MALNFEQRLRVPADVLVSDLDGEMVMLNLKTAFYYGLDPIGSRMLNAVTASESVGAAYHSLSTAFDVDPEQLRSDLLEIVDQLIELGLLEVQ